MRLSFGCAAVLVIGGAMAGCGPIQTRNTIVIEQKDPVVVNVNVSGRLVLVIADARKDMEAITGEKAKRQVSLEDIGLPAQGPGSRVEPVNEMRVILAMVAPATEDGLIKSMTERNAKVRGLLSAKVAGEGHDGLLAERGKLLADQKATLDAENNDRRELYKLRATKNNTKETEAALAYYLQRLGYAEKGDWVEKYNKEKKAWEWVQWDG